MSMSGSPYVGTWRIDGKKLVQSSPDSLVYLNGDTSLPGCPKCHRKIDLQQFLTEVSVEAGTEPQGASCTFTLSIPSHHTDSFARDAKFILRPGLEVHVYQRGYFPVEGMFSALSKPTITAEVQAAGGSIGEPVGVPQNQGVISQQGGPPPIPKIVDKTGLGFANDGKDHKKAFQVVIHETITVNSSQAIAALKDRHVSFHYMLDTNGDTLELLKPGTLGRHVANANAGRVGVEVVNIFNSAKALPGQTLVSNAVWAPVKDAQNQVYAAPSQSQLEALWGTMVDQSNKLGIPMNFPAVSDNGSFRFGKLSGEASQRPGFVSHQQLKDHEDGSFPLLYGVLRSRGFNPEDAYKESIRLASLGVIEVPLPAPVVPDLIPSEVVEFSEEEALVTEVPKQEIQIPPDGPSLLDQMGLGDTGIDDVVAYPYYHTFHGVTTQVTFNYASGVNTVTVQCSSLLYFWQYQHISENASFLGARPTNSKLKMSLMGSNFSGKHPYQILYELYSDVGGAAHGVGWSLSQAQNQDALSFNGESLFSLTTRYWERRFKSRMNKLRLHGFTGELYSAAQAAFLSKTPTSDLMALIKSKHSLASGTTDKGKGIFNNAFFQHVTSPAALNGLVQSFQQAPTDPNTPNARSQIGVNLADMEPWPLDLGKMGQVELFESTYVSKQDVAIKCMEVTGFEFYQDVDGDFVFKPPMYNLDTSSSRVYRIEDIDIISINFSEKEPQATYMTVKGEVFKNIQGVGLENEWGVKGQYIDYRLVAQFGWRPGSVDTAYYNDPKSCFFAAVNRLDIMNAPSSSATVTIPIRPELRPGYPVYIPYVDCYFYCPSFSHSFSVGGTCQTTLQLIAKRSKFYAPGKYDPTIEGIDAIDLSNPILPERPLQVIDENGRPRLSGFPNVVMALDPTQLNPLFFFVGEDADSLGDPQTVENLLKKATELNVLTLDNSTNPPTYVAEIPDSSGKARNVRFSHQGLDETRIVKKPGEGAVRVISDVAAKLQDSRKRLAQEQKEIANKQLANRQAQAQVKNAVAGALKPEDKVKPQAELDRLKAEEKSLDQQEADRKLRLQEISATDGSDISDLKILIELTGSAYRLKAGPDFPNLASTASLLDLLSEKKAVFSNGQQPGYYRYYSASHPKKDQQGQRGVQVTAKGESILTDPNLEQPATALQYMKAPTAQFPGGQKPEAQLAENNVEWGIRVNVADAKAFPKGATLPTNQIREVMFARHELETRRPLTNTVPQEVPLTQIAVSQALRKGFTLEAVGKTGRIADTDTIRSVYEKAWTSRTKYLTDAQKTVVATFEAPVAPVVPVVPPLSGDAAFTLLQPAFTVTSSSGTTAVFGQIPPIVEPLFPKQIVIEGKVFSTESPMSSFVGKEAPLWQPSTVPNQTPVPSTELEKLGLVSPPSSLAIQLTTPSATDLMKKAGQVLGFQLVQDIAAARSDWIKELANFNAGSQALKPFDFAFASKVAASSSSGDKTKGKEEFKLEQSFESPVFPVSDEHGYHVYGSYRYGRGANIDPDGVFDVIHKQDPTSMLSRELVEEIISVLVDGHIPATIFNTATKPNGQIMQVPVTSTSEAKTILEERARKEMKTNFSLTDKDLLDMKLASATTDPNVLQMDLNNFIPRKDNDALQKVPLINAAYSLADLTQTPLGHVCSCKAAEAGVILEAFGQANFIPIAHGDATEETQTSPDQLTRWLGQVTAEAVGPWKQAQDALRGTILDRKGSTVIETFKNVIDGQIKDGVDAATELQRKQTAFDLARIKALGEGL